MPTSGAAIATWFGASASTAAAVGTATAVVATAATAYSAYSALTADRGGQSGSEYGGFGGPPSLNDVSNASEMDRRRRVASSRLLQNPTGGLGDVSTPSLAVKTLLGA